MLWKKKNSFYIKHDFPTILVFAEKYGLKISLLKNLVSDYLEIEKRIFKHKYLFEEIDLKDISLGPKTLLVARSSTDDFSVHISFNFKKDDLDIGIFLADMEYERKLEDNEFEKFSREFTLKIKCILDQDIL